jgi:hypothetical protein
MQYHEIPAEQQHVQVRRSGAKRGRLLMSGQAGRRPWRSIHEFLCSFLVAWLAVWYRDSSPHPIWEGISPWAQTWVQNFWRNVSPEPEVVLGQVVVSSILGAVLFFLSRIYTRFRLPGSLALAVTGAISFVGFPLFALQFPIYFFYPFRIESWAPWLALETVGLLICGVLYWIEKWPCGVGPSMALLILHFGLWAWVTGMWPNPLREIHSSATRMSGVWISMLFYSGFPALGLLSTVTWWLSVRELHARTSN